jgi:hypothetical protein
MWGGGDICKTMEDLARDAKVECSGDRFRAAVDILVRKPHSINKKIVGATILKVFPVSTMSELEIENLRNECLAMNHPCNVNLLEQGLPMEAGCKVVRRLVPKRIDKEEPATELIMWDVGDGGKWLRATFIPLINNLKISPVNATFCVEWTGLGSGLRLEVNSGADERCREWLKNSLFPTLVKWCSEKTLQATSPSARLVDLERYQRKYLQIKETHGKKLIEVRNLIMHVSLVTSS